ncbi:MAG: hypothetical protein DRJ03_02705 [Chloroflexi bacterium]|nr:MAG: hypothetical protein DRJ03_02705 [Chloroflexota bacterium]
MIDRYNVLARNFNGSEDCADDATLTVAFKNSDGDGSTAKRVQVRITADDPAWDGKVHYKYFASRDPAIPAAAPVTTDNFFLYVGESELEIPAFTGQIQFLNKDAVGAVGIRVYIDAFSDEDISGTTMT